VNRAVLVAGLAVTVPVLAILLLNLGRDPRIVESPLVGRPAPPFTLSRAGGGPAVSLAALRGKPVVLNFWATWCVPCYEEHGLLVAAARALAAEVQFLGVVWEDTEQQVLAYLRTQGSAYPSLLDPEGRTAIAYGIAGVPETFFIDGDGRIVAKVTGPVNQDNLKENLRKAMGKGR
jgi:cytochrome c biogenesis protein CcmG/thiol:disulfide interchange protein DsbE